MKKTLLILAGLLIAIVVVAQQGTLTQQSASKLDSAAATCTATGAGNTTVTCTLGPPPAGQFVYVTSCTVDESANGAITGAAGPAGVFTTTNLTTNQIWWADNATQVTGWHAIPMNVSWPTGLKAAAAGTSFTLAQTGGQSTQSFRLNCAGYYAP